MKLDELVLLFRVDALKGLSDLNKVQSDISETRATVNKVTSGFRGFASAISLAAVAMGAYKLAQRQINFGNIATQTGHSIKTVAALSRSFEMAGLSAESAQSALRSYADEIGNYQYKGTPSATLTAANILGVNFKDAKGEFREAQDLYLDLAKREMERVGGDKQQAFQSMVYLRGLNRELAQWALNTTRSQWNVQQQEAAIDERRKAQLTDAVARYKGLQNQIEDLSVTLLTNFVPVANQAFDSFKPIIDAMVSSPQAIENSIKAFVNFRLFALNPLVGTFTAIVMWFDKALELLHKFSKFISTENYSKDVKENFDALAEHGTKKLGLDKLFDGVKSAIGMEDTTPAPSSGSINDRKKYVYDRLINEGGLTPEQASGVIGNLMQESQLNPSAVGGAGEEGIMQWHEARKDQFRKLFGKRVKDATLEEQVQYMLWESKNWERKNWDLLRKTTSAQEAAVVFSEEVERPGSPELQKRARYAVQAYHQMTGRRETPVNALAFSKHAGKRGQAININGAITINTRATDAKGIERDLSKKVVKIAKAKALNNGYAA